MPDRRRVDHCVVMQRRDDCWIVSIDLDAGMPLGLHVHRGERNAAIRMLMVRSGGTFIKSSQFSQSCVFDASSRQAAEQLTMRLRERLYRIACKPISQGQVEQILGITSRERIRWGKDGRLPLSGTSRIKKGTTEISLWTYPCRVIEQLAANPAAIRRWREEDEARTPIGLASVFV